MSKITDQHLIMEEHQQALQLCSRIREGLQNNVEYSRIRAYVNWFRSTCLEPHFEIEEKYVFPVLGSNVRVKRAFANHRRIRKLLSCSCENNKVLNLLEEELTSYIRYEERMLWNDFKIAQELRDIQRKHQADTFSDEDWGDRFWEI